MIKAHQDAGAGALLIVIAVIALWLGSDLPVGSLRQLGPGMFPRVLALLVGGVGLLILIDSFLEKGPDFEAWHWRGPLFVLGAAVAFGLVIRPLGLIVAAPLVMMVSAYASPDTRGREVLLFTVAMTAFCIGLFRLALGLPIPLAPWLIGY